MTLVFFGRHSQDWMNVLNSRLLPKLHEKNNNIQKIINYGIITKFNDARYIIPLTEKHMIELYNKKINAIMPPLELIHIFMCKKRFAQYVEKSNLLEYTPRTFLKKDTCNDALFIIKPINLSNGDGMLITKEISNVDFDVNLIQEYIPNNVEYVSHIVAHMGLIIECITYKYTIENKHHIRTSNTKKITEKVLQERQYTDILEKFLLPCQYTGICNIDYICVDNVVKVFEINPRLGGSLMQYENDLVIILDKLIQLYDIMVQ